MPTIYLSPSTQEYNPYVTGSGSEEYWMKRLADAMAPYLNSCGIRYTRKHPGHDPPPAPSGRPTRGGTTCISPSTPTPPAPAARGRTGGSSPSTIPAVPRDSGQPRSLSTTCARSTPCRTRW